ncbi:MAG: tetratricopeptide repeat protein [Calditrichia bacterium]
MPPQIGQKIGVYTLLEPLGSGGMGEVWRAERSDGRYQQQVAIKLMQAFRQTPDGIYHFARERQILASLQHPGIARLLDGGITDEGQLYYVMEYVDGISITQYCSENSLSVSQKINLFQKVCSAVRYAHQKLIVHSDLKPEHILINREGHVKLLDFGLARLQEQQSGETLAKEPFFTPAYASPEQIAGDVLTTSADVYSLGVVLYEMLANSHPFDLENKTALQTLKIVTEKEPLSPSLKHRNSESSSNKYVTPELDLICLKALRKKPEERYVSVEALVEDLSRYEAGLPIAAKPESRFYTFRKYVQRHALASVFAAVAITTIIFTTTFYTLKLQQERTTAIEEQQRAESLTNFLQQLFETGERRGNYAAELTAKQLVDQGAQRIEVELKDQPQMQAILMRTIGRVYYRLGLQDLEQKFQQKGMELALGEFPENSLELIESRRAFAEALSHAGKNAEADSQLTIALHVAGDKTREEYRFQQHSAVINDLAVMKRRQKKYSETIPLLEQALKMGEEAGDTVQTLTSMFNLANTYRRTNKMAEAEDILIRLIPLVKDQFGEDHPHMASSLSSLGIVYQQLGLTDKAIQHLQESLSLREKVYGESHPKLRSVLNYLADLHAEKGDMQHAIKLRRRSTEISRKFYGNDHRYVLDNLINIISDLVKVQRYNEAQETHQELIELTKTAFGVEHERMARVKKSAGDLYHAMKRPDEAEVHYREAVRIIRKAFPADNHKHYTYSYSLADFLQEQKRYDEADPIFLHCLEIISKNAAQLANEHPPLLKKIVGLYVSMDRPEKAEKFRAILLESTEN